MLRDVLESDLEELYEHQRDPEATSLAGFVARERDAFMTHWRNKVLANPANKALTIVADDRVAGYVASWESEGKRLVAYWIDRALWGRGIATSALGEFLRDHESTRPIYAYVAVSNAPSIRVLEKCGFQRSREPAEGSDEVREVLLVLGGAP